MHIRLEKSEARLKGQFQNQYCVVLEHQNFNHVLQTIINYGKITRIVAEPEIWCVFAPLFYALLLVGA